LLEIPRHRDKLTARISLNDQALITPFLIPNFFDASSLAYIQRYVTEVKASGALQMDAERFFRAYKKDDPFFHKLLRMITPQAQALFGPDVRPNFSFMSCYLPDQGFCPVHYDVPECHRTIEVCLNQREPWPLFINHRDSETNARVLRRMAEAGNYRLTLSEMEELKREGTAYLMQPGDAICYSGTGNAHWRETIQPGNFCDLVFFHFATEELLLKERASIASR
jgi:hypothetical protein